MIAAAIFSFAGIYAGFAPMPDDVSWVGGWLLVACWTIAGLCAAGVLA